MEVLLFMSFFAFLCVRVAKRKGRSPALWGTLGLLTGFVGLAICLLFPKKKSSNAGASGDLPSWGYSQPGRAATNPPISPPVVARPAPSSFARGDERFGGAPREKEFVRFLNEASPTNPAKYNSAIAVVSPFLVNPVLLDTSSIEQAHDVAEASKFLMENSNTTMFDTDSLARLNKVASLRCIELSIVAGPGYLSQPGIGEAIGRMVITHVLGALQPYKFDELWFSHCFENYKKNLTASLLSEGVVGNVLVGTHGLGAIFGAAQKADKRSRKGRYSPSDLQILRTLAAQHRPVVTFVARYQQAMGWQTTTWDPVSIFEPSK